MNAYYSEKVMDHFKNPRNIGEMDDADVVAQKGNPVCLVSGERILFNDSLSEIDNFSVHTHVYSHDYTRNKIIRRIKRQYEGEILHLKNCFGQTILTPDHLIYAMKLPSHEKYLRHKFKRTLSPAWYHADCLNKSDIAVYPIPQEEKEVEYIKTDVEKSRWDFRSNDIPEKIPVNEDLLRLFGYFLSEGNIQNRPCKTYISLTLNIKEKDIARDIENIVGSLFNIKVKKSIIVKRKTLVVYIYNVHLARLFKKLFGNGANKKKIPEFIMRLPIKKQKALIFGLWKGDGYINLDRKGSRGGYATVSVEMAEQIKILLLRQGIIPSIYTEKAKVSKWANHKQAYRIHVGQRSSLKKLSSILGTRYNPDSYESIDSWIEGGYCYVPITKITRSKYKGEVFNLEVGKTHTYISQAFSLHNCGDQMKLYLKIGKKEGKEYIKDISFQTLGCASAIATTSMLTELAKGKTLDEAYKINREDIAKSLGGLPPIKMHCSVLSQEVLKSAIDKWRSKNEQK